MTPSPGYCCSCIPKSRQRCATNLSLSSKESLSRRSAIRSRALSLPSAFCRSRRCLPPPSSAARFIWIRCSMREVAVTLVIRKCLSLWERVLFDDGDFLPVLQELLDSLIRQRMFQELIEYFGGHGADVGATQACLNDMNGIAYGSDEHLSLEFIVVEDRHDIADQVHSILADIIQAADKGADEIRAGLCGHDRLGRGKYERHIHANAFFTEGSSRLQSFFSHRTFHDDIRMQFCQMPAFLDHSCGITADRLGAHRPVHQRTDFQKLIFKCISFFRNQRWVCRNSIQHAGTGGIADLLKIGRIEEEFHVGSPCQKKHSTTLSLYRRG